MQPLIADAVSLTEELAQKQISGKCRRANLPGPVCQDILKDCAWADRAKKMISEGGAELAAMGLNNAEVPLEARPWAKMGFGLGQIAVGHLRVLSRLEKLIQFATASAAPAAPDPAPADKKS